MIILNLEVHRLGLLLGRKLILKRLSEFEFDFKPCSKQVFRFTESYVVEQLDFLRKSPALVIFRRMLCLVIIMDSYRMLRKCVARVSYFSCSRFLVEDLTLSSSGQSF